MEGIKRTRVHLLVTVISLLIISSCLHIEKKVPEYRIQLDGHVRKEMNDMSTLLSELSDLSLDSSQSTKAHAQSVLTKLDQIEAIASSMGGPGVLTNYSVINRYMGAFLYDIQLARKFSKSNPPNHFPAYSLVKSCLSCHQSI